MQLDLKLFPSRVSWKMCNGSRPHLRGYPCGLWLLMHTLTVLTLPLNHTHSSLNHTHQPHPITSTRALTIVTKFIRNFFSCEVCREHFVAMARTLSLGDPGDAVLWAWEAHNVVNARLSLENGSGDPFHPKHLFPSISRCPYCYQLVAPGPYGSSHAAPNFTNTRFAGSEGLLVGVADRGERSPRLASRNMLRASHQQSPEGANVYVWNRTAILLYLWNYYHLNKHWTKAGMEHGHHGVSQSAVLQAAWPRTFGGGKHHLQLEWQRSAESADPEECFLPYVLCVVVLSLLLWGLWRKRRCRALAWVRPFTPT